MITTKEKALELFYKYNSETSNEFKSDTFTSAKTAKKCVLIAVDEIISALDEHQWQNRFVIEFYNEVKTEIEKL
jgi:hypothetical protein